MSSLASEMLSALPASLLHTQHRTCSYRGPGSQRRHDKRTHMGSLGLQDLWLACEEQAMTGGGPDMLCELAPS